jgi:2-haloalkanoic acid dehalogenase type II
MLRAVIFDMDETLIDWSKRQGEWADISREHLRPIYNHLKSEGYRLPSLDQVVQMYGDRTRQAWNAMNPPHWDCPPQFSVLHQVLADLDLSLNKTDLRRLEELFAWDAIPGVRPFEDTIDVLRTLRSAELRTGLLTNAMMPMRMRDAELRAYGLLDYLDVRLTAGDIGKFKPHPEVFRVILERLDVPPVNAIFVGDSPQHDVAGAQAVGMRAIWVRRADAVLTDSIRPNAVVDSLSGILAILDFWYPGWR